MKITIDTATDSHEDIRKVIQFLQKFVGESVVMSNAPVRDMFAPSPSAPVHDDPMSMVGSASPAPVAHAAPAQASSAGGLFNMFGESAPASNVPLDQVMQSSEEEKESVNNDVDIQTY